VVGGRLRTVSRSVCVEDCAVSPVFMGRNSMAWGVGGEVMEVNVWVVSREGCGVARRKRGGEARNS
jgi:hypothetical protein